MIFLTVLKFPLNKRRISLIKMSWISSKTKKASRYSIDLNVFYVRTFIFYIVEINESFYISAIFYIFIHS